MVLGFLKKGPGGVGCYGKLPFHGDYLYHQNDGPEARRFTAWLDEGYRLTRGEDDPAAAGTRFVTPGRGRRTLFGSFWPSADSSGTRRFPFALFAELPARPLAQIGYFIPVALSEVWAEMAEVVPSIREAGNQEAIPGLLARIRIPDLPHPEDEQKRLGRAGGDPGPLSAVAEVLFDTLRMTDALGGDRKGDLPAFAVRLPLRSGARPEHEAAAWLEIFTRRTRADSLPARSHLFLRPGREGGEGEFFFFHRDLRAEDLGFIISPTEDYPYANCLGSPDEDEELAAFRRWFDENAPAAGSLRDLVDLALSR